MRALFGLAVLAVAGSLAGTARAADLVVVAYGGIWEKAVRECFVAPFEKATGKTAAVQLGGPDQWLNQIAANREHPPIDVVLTGLDSIAVAIDKGLLDKMDVEHVPHLAEIGPDFVKSGHGYGSVFDYGGMGLAYNTQTIKDPPKSWQEFVDGTIAGKWKAAIPGINYSFTPMEVIWLYAHLYGGSVDNVAPGLAKIKQMRDSGNLVFWNDVNQYLNMMKSGDIDIGMYWDGRAWAFHQDGNPNIAYLNPKPGSPVNPTIISKVKNGSDLAWKYIDIVLSPEPQTCFAKLLVYGVTNTKVVYPPDIAAHISKPDEIIWPEFDAAAPHISSWIEQWNKQLGG